MFLTVSRPSTAARKVPSAARSALGASSSGQWPQSGSAALLTEGEDEAAAAAPDNALPLCAQGWGGGGGGRARSGAIRPRTQNS